MQWLALWVYRLVTGATARDRRLRREILAFVALLAAVAVYRWGME